MLKKEDKIGAYHLIKRLGSGGFGDVWHAEKRTVLSVSEFALKFFRPKDDKEIDLDKVKQEIAIGQKLSGLPNVISLIEADIYEDYVYLVSEFADGGSLDKYLTANGGTAKSHAEAVKITREILKGLESLHSQKFVHRDLKPANVLIKKGQCYLADFGISREMKSQSKSTSTAGTYEYMSPEAFQKKPIITVHTDIWAVGIILHQLLTGKLPFSQEEMPSLITAVLFEPPDLETDNLPHGIAEIIEKALQKNREMRYATANEMREALKKAWSTQKIKIEAKTLVNDEELAAARAEIEQRQKITDENLNPPKPTPQSILDTEKFSLQDEQLARTHQKLEPTQPAIAELKTKIAGDEGQFAPTREKITDEQNLVVTAQKAGADAETVKIKEIVETEEARKIKEIAEAEAFQKGIAEAQARQQQAEIERENNKNVEIKAQPLLVTHQASSNKTVEKKRNENEAKAVLPVINNEPLKPARFWLFGAAAVVLILTTIGIFGVWQLTKTGEVPTVTPKNETKNAPSVTPSITPSTTPTATPNISPTATPKVAEVPASTPKAEKTPSPENPKPQATKKPEIVRTPQITRPPATVKQKPPVKPKDEGCIFNGTC